MEFRPEELYTIGFKQEDGSIINEVCHRFNTDIFNHTLEEDGDHIFIMHRLFEHTKEGIILWRREVAEAHDDATYTKILRGLGAIGCQTIESDYMTEIDRETYATRFGEYPRINGEQNQLPEDDLWLGYPRNIIMPEDFDA